MGEYKEIKSGGQIVYVNKTFQYDEEKIFFFFE